MRRKSPAKNDFTFLTWAMCFNSMSNFPFLSLNPSPMRCLPHPSCIIMDIIQNHLLLPKVKYTESAKPRTAVSVNNSVKT